LRRNCLIKHVTEGQIEGREDKKEDVSSYWITLRKRKYRKLKEEEIVRSLRKTRFGGGYTSVVRQITE